MKRRLMSVVYFLVLILISVLMLVSFVTFPVWLIVWILTGWWIYPWGNTTLHNLSKWVMVRSAERNWPTSKHYQKSDYQRLKKS